MAWTREAGVSGLYAGLGVRREGRDDGVMGLLGAKQLGLLHT